MHCGYTMVLTSFATRSFPEALANRTTCTELGTANAIEKHAFALHESETQFHPFSQGC